MTKPQINVKINADMRNKIDFLKSKGINISFIVKNAITKEFERIRFLETHKKI
jgi:hypothetical protein